jgi:uncharacterized membrane protein
MVALEMFSKFGGEFFARWAHVVAGVCWIGLLYYFNFVQVPAFAEMDAPARNNAIDKLASRALWWFRWSAAATALLGFVILGFQDHLSDMDYFKSPAGVSIVTGMVLGLTMLANVWGVIWRNQKIVIANARNVQAGGEADPAAAAAGRTALLASRQNTIFSFPMLMFMLGTSHFFPAFNTADNRGIYYLFALVIWLLFELNCLGVIGGKAAGGLNWVYDSHKNTIITGLVLVVVYYALWEIILK